MARAKKQVAAGESPATVTASENAVVAYKGFNKDWTCRGYQFEVGKSYEHVGPVKSCDSGFHACKHPLSVFGFYAPGQSRYAEVKLSGTICDKETPDTKIAAAKISIEVELSISDLVKRAWGYVWSRATVEGETATGYQGAASSTGTRGAASSTGTRGAASSTGTRGAASSTGDYGAASSTGHQGAASSTGNYGAASSTG
ncbi:MAG: hypothetical protein LCH38_14625, partial [Proteobacteria bacterium]|nr:hypothetical protein [Pseudomonadota bacterium]